MAGRSIKAGIAVLLLFALIGCNSVPAADTGHRKTDPSGTGTNGMETGTPPDSSQDNTGQEPLQNEEDEAEGEGANPSGPPAGQGGKAEPAQPEGQHAVTAAYFVDEKNAIRPVDGESAKETKIALITIDDAPAGASTGKILDILDKYGAKAIWFVNGYYADKHRELLKEIHERGHLIGNHTWWHKNLKTLTPEETRKEILSLNELIEEVTGVRPVYFRPPFGVNSEAARQVLKEEKMQAMNWTWGSLDWELKTAEAIEKNVVDHIHNGANILFHDKEITAEALDGILKQLKGMGYQFVLPTEVRVKN